MSTVRESGRAAIPAPSPTSWGEIEPSLLEDVRARCPPFPWTCCRPSGGTGSGPPLARPARPTTMWRCQCWQPSQALQAQPPRCASRRAGSSRWCCGRRSSVRPRRLAGLLQASPELAARFLFTWLHARSHVPIASRAPSDNEAALASLRRLADRLSGDPLVLAAAEAGLATFDAFTARLHAERILSGLQQAGVVERAPDESPARGRPTTHWRINPALFENAFTENTENRLAR